MVATTGPRTMGSAAPQTMGSASLKMLPWWDVSPTCEYLIITDLSVHPVAVLRHGPLEGDLLLVAPEGDAVLAGDVPVAEAGLVEAPEGEGLPGHRHPNVDAHHARVG